MSLYKTTMAMCAGVGLILLSQLVGRISTPYSTRDWDRRLWAAACTVLGLVLTVIGMLIANTSVSSGSAAFGRVVGESGLLLGLLHVATGLYLWTKPGPISDIARADLAPAAVAATATGVMLITFSAGITYFGVIANGALPEPVIGLPYPLYAPKLEAAALAAIYLAVGVGSLLAPLTKLAAGRLLDAVRALWFGAGAALVGISAWSGYLLTGLSFNGIHESTRYI